MNSQMFIDAFNIIFPIIPVLKRPGLANISLIIFIFFMLWLVYHYIYKRFLRQEIQPLLIALQAAEVALRRPAERSTAEHLTVVRDFFRTDARLGGLWNEYERTLLCYETVEAQEEVYSTVDAELFFSEEKILAAQGMNLQVYQAVPGYLTGMGILGTFWGLTVGLSQVNLASQDIEVLREGIRGLLEGIGTKFSTSLWGLVLSLLCSWYEKRKRNQVRQEIFLLQQLIDQICQRRPQESWLAGILAENRRQTQSLQILNTDLANALAEAVGRQFSRTVTPVLGGLTTAIDELRQSGSNQMAQAINEGAGQQMALLGQVLASVQTTLTQTVDRSGDMQVRLHEQMGSQVKDMSATVNQVLELAVSKQAEMSQQTELKLQKVLDTMANNLYRQQEQMAQNTEQFSSDFAAKMNYVQEQTGAHISNMSGVVNETLDTALTQQQEMGDKTQQKMQQVLDIMTLNLTRQQEELQKTTLRLGEEFSGRMEQVTAQLANLLNRFEENSTASVKTLAGTVRDVLHDSVTKQNELNDKAWFKVENLQESLERSTVSAGESFTANMAGVARDMTSILVNFEGAMTGQAGRMSTEMQQLFGQFQETFSAVAGRYEQEREQLRVLLDELRLVLTVASENVVQSGVAAAAFGAAALPMRDGATQLQGALMQMQQCQQTFTDIVRESEVQMKKQLEQAQQSAETIDRSLQLTQESWQAYETKFGLVRGDLDGVFQSLAEGLREYRALTDESLTQFLDRTQHSLSQCVGHLSTAIAELGETVEDLYPVLEKSKQKNS